MVSGDLAICIWHIDENANEINNNKNACVLFFVEFRISVPQPDRNKKQTSPWYVSVVKHLLYY